jgi:hypothetical protein
MIDNVKARNSLKVIHGAEIEQHRRTGLAKSDEARAQIAAFDALDLRIVKGGTNGCGVDGT